MEDANCCAIVARPDDNPDECIFVNATSGFWTIFETFTSQILADAIGLGPRCCFCRYLFYKATLKLGTAPVLQLLIATRLT